jgi:NAD(P)-dependent dehydrogenase (short-subunit alcohol dehydrogenase family)
MNNNDQRQPGETARAVAEKVPGLVGKRVLVTGAGGAIGGAVVEHMLAAGARVVASDRSAKSLQGIVDRFGDNITTVVADVSDPGDMSAATDVAVSTFGGLDVAVLCAGIEGAIRNVDEADIEVFDQVMAVNVKGVWLGMKYAVAAMKENAQGGSIIALSSVAGTNGAAGASIYTTSKHAVIGMVRSVAAEVGLSGIRVNAVCPAPIEGRMMQSLERGFSADRPELVRQSLEKKIPMGRYGLPSEVAAMITFLASDQASFCTGGVYKVDGGKTAV